MTQSVSVLDAELFYSRPLATPPMPVTINHPILILPLTQLMTCIMYSTDTPQLEACQSDRMRGQTNWSV